MSVTSAEQIPTVQRALRLARAGRTDAARVLLWRALEIERDNAQGWALMAHLAYDLQDPSRTIYCLEQVVRLQPENIKAQEHLHYLTGRTIIPVAPPEIPTVDHDQSSRKPTPMWMSLGAASLLIAIVLSATYFLFGNQRASAADMGDDPAHANPDASAIRPFESSISRQLARLMDASQRGPVQVTTPTPAPPPAMIDYSGLQAALQEHMRMTAAHDQFDLGIAFVDISTGQLVTINGNARFHAMSTFKGPLAVYYWWLYERGMITEQARDRDHLANMLEYSANTDTSCIFERVGGIAPFNDWLAQQGFTREMSFVLKWSDWDCNDNGENYVPPIDWRYSRGDESLGLPGDTKLLECPIPQLPCDKAFAPAELAQFYARLYRGEVISPAYRDILLPMMVEGKAESIFLNDLPRGAEVTVYIKGGSFQQTKEYRVNFVDEAGIVETPRGAYALAIFMQQNPEWPGTWPMSEAARLVYDAFMEAHEPAQQTGN